MSSDTYDKKTVEGMVLKMLWEKVFVNYDAKSKEAAIRTLRKSSDYDKLMEHLVKVKKEKVEYILNLLVEIIIVYVS